MTGAFLNLLLNIIIVALLAATISYCWLLNRRIKVLQDSKSELATLLKYFDESTQRASDSIIALQTASKKIGENIQLRIDKANFLVDDLSFMIEKGSKLADQMEASFAVNRARTRVMNEPGESNTAQPAMPKKSMPVLESAPIPSKTPTLKDKAPSSLEAVLDKIAGRSNKPAPSENTSKARSKAEQELLDMLKGGVKG